MTDKDFEKFRQVLIDNLIEAVRSMTDEELFAFASKYPEFDLTGLFSSEEDEEDPSPA